MAVTHDINEKNLKAQGFRPLHAGDDYDYKFTITGLDNGDLLTAIKIWFTAKENAGDADPGVLQLDSDAAAEIEILNATELIVKFRSSLNGQGAGKVTDDLTAGPYPYDIKLKDETSKLVRAVDGEITFSPNITRADV